MKIRQGFVSNSSSSSFMIGVAKVTDHNKFHKWLKSCTFDSCDVKACLYAELESGWGCVKKDGGYSTESFNGSTVSIPGGSLVDTDTVVVLEIASNEGDGAFWVKDGPEMWDGYMNYEIDIDFFHKDEQELFGGMSEDNGMTLVDKTFGAGRNG